MSSSMQRRASLLVDKESGCPFRIRHLDDVIEGDTSHLQRRETERKFQYDHFDVDDYKVANQLLRGGVKLDELPCQEAKIVRMFVCSSGQDFEAERNYLFESVYSTVREHCRASHGVDFQLVDLCWGDSSMPSTDPFKMAVMSGELKHCQEVSIGPNVVLFMGQKYGSYQLPTEILSTHLQAIKEQLTYSEVDCSLLDEWYKEDRHVTPHVCRLKQGTGGEDILDVYDDLLDLIQTGASICDEDMNEEWNISYFEQLVMRGILNRTQEQRDSQCIVYMRDVQNIDEHLGAKNAGTFIDLEPDTNEWSVEKKQACERLRNRVEESIRQQNIVKTTIALNGSSLDQETSGRYLADIGRHFFSTVTKLVAEVMEKESPIGRDSLLHELAAQWGLVKAFTGPYIAHDEILDSIKRYLLTESDQPLVFTGSTGTGKSSLIAKAASDINEAVSNSNVSMPTALIVRFIGETGSSRDIQPILFNLCHQLAAVTGRYRQDIPADYQSLKNYFIELVQRGEYGGMLVILMDSLDMLSTTDNGHRLEWLPSRLAANVKIIATVNAEYEDMMERLMNKVEDGVVAIPDYKPSTCEDIVKLLMSEYGVRNSVSYDEWKRIKLLLQTEHSPLFARLVYEQTISKWQPFDILERETVEKSLEEHVMRLFSRLEKTHGVKLVKKMLGYLTAVKTGLTESELDDILSLDDKVLNDIYVSNKEYPHMRRMPHFPWSNLRQDIEPYLVQRKNGGVATITWRFSIFTMLAAERYLSNEEDATNIYFNMADYFLGIWDGTKRKPFKHPSVLMAKYKLVEREDESCRNLPSQPLSFGDYRKCNYRKLNLLPFILVQSQRCEELKKHVFCNYEWLSCKLQTTTIQKTIADFELFDDREATLVADALRMSKSALLIDPGALGVELTGRLLPHINKYRYIKDLIRQCDLTAQRCCPLVSNCQMYSAPGGPLQYECDIGGGVKCPVDIGVFSSPDGILLTAKPAHSQRLRVWELSRGDERPDILLPLGDLKPTRDGRYLNIFVENKILKTYRSDCGVLYGEIKYGPGTIADVDVSNKYLALVLQKGAGPYVFDLERSEIIHKFSYHTHAVAISEDENFVAFNAERNVLLYELPTMQRRCVATATDIPHDIIFINDLPKCVILTKTKLIETLAFDVINRKFKSKSVLTDMEAKEIIPSNSKRQVIIRSSKALHIIDTLLDKVTTKFQKLPPGVFVDSSSQFTGAGFTPDDSMIVASRYTYLIIWDAETTTPIRVLQSSVSPVLKLFTSDRTNKVVTLLENSTFQVWNLDNLDRDTDHSIETHRGAVQHVSVSTSAQYILSHDNETPDAKLVCLSSGKVVDTFLHSEHPADRILDVMFSPDGLYAVTRARVEQLNGYDKATFGALTDDFMWEVETASKVFHAMSSRYTIFSPSSDVAAFITCAFYNRYDWTENIYNVFIVHPENSSNYTIDFPYSTEFVSPPKIIAADDNYIMAAVQICRRNTDGASGKEVARWNEVRLLIQSLAQPGESGEQTILRLQNLTEDVNDNDQFLDIIPIRGGNVLVVYGQDIEGYEFVTDKGIMPPKILRKGVILMNVDKLEALQHIPSFLESSSQIQGLQISSQFTYILDSDLKLFTYGANSFQHKIQACALVPGSARLSLDGRYVIGIAAKRSKIVVIRSSDDKLLGSVFVHGKAVCLEVADDDRTVVVGCEDGRIMVMSLILEFADPLREHIGKLQSRCDDDFDGDLIVSDIRRLSMSTPDQHRLSARLQKSAQDDERRPPSYTTLQRAVTISRMSNRERSSSSCAQQ